VSDTGETIAAKIEAAVLPLLEQNGYELVLTEYVPRSRVLRLFIDRSGDENSVDLDDCTQVSRMVSDMLDGEGYSDLIDSRYTLEVSSPGLDRPLVKPMDFQRFVGRTAKVKTRVAKDGQRNFNGELVSADEQGIRLEVEGEPRTISYGEIRSARLVPDL